MDPEEQKKMLKFKESDELAAVKYREDKDWETYTEDEHRRWRELYDRQMNILKGRAAPEFFENAKELQLERERIPKLDELNDLLRSQSGWEAVPVPGLIPGIFFFEYLADKKFPVTNWIRSRQQMDYIVEPDMFHDSFGHLPMIADPTFANYLQHYGKEALKSQKLSDKTGIDVLENLARTYWFTVEFGLINTEKNDGLRIYGAGIQSSKTESIYSLESPKPRRIAFDLERTMRTQYDYSNLQNNYFVIDSYDQLLDETSSKRINEMNKILIEDHHEYGLDAKLNTDRLIPPNSVKHFY